MKAFFHSRLFYIVVILLVVSAILLTAYKINAGNGVEIVTTIAETGPVRELVSVSGIARAKQTAELAFPVTGIVEFVFVEKGESVKAGDPLVTIEADALLADRQDALAAISSAIANRDELLSGPTRSARDISEENIYSTEDALENTKTTERQKVANAYAALLSTDLTAYSTNLNESAKSPVITGTYNCDVEGSYLLNVYSSQSRSGYSYKLSGLESGTYQASVEQAGPLGNCGLQILFDRDSMYHNTKWVIDLPNTKSPYYVTNRNNYHLSIAQADSAISTAEKAFAMAKLSSTNENAPARDEAITRANSAIAQADATLQRIDSTIADRQLRAPFDGIITEIDILPGETIGPVPVLTLLAGSDFEVTARIPEIDIGQLKIGQKANMLFDARRDEILTGEISFISLKATEIDGVSYYEATIKLDRIPDWIRSGLNADIEIIIAERTDAIRLPKRFINKSEEGFSVLLHRNGVTATTSVDILLNGNDGYTAVTGLSEGDVIFAP